MLDVVVIIIVAAVAISLGILALATARVQRRVGAHLGLPDTTWTWGFITGKTIYRGYMVVLHGQPFSSVTGPWRKLSRLKITVVGDGIAESGIAIRAMLASRPEVAGAEFSGTAITLSFRELWLGELLTSPEDNWKAVEIIDEIIRLTKAGKPTGAEGHSAAEEEVRR
jgi:hypothetical protein